MTTGERYGVLWLTNGDEVHVSAGALEHVEHALKEYARTRTDRLIRLRLETGAPAGVLASHIRGFHLSTPSSRAAADDGDGADEDSYHS